MECCNAVLFVSECVPAPSCKRKSCETEDSVRKMRKEVCSSSFFLWENVCILIRLEFVSYVIVYFLTEEDFGRSEG